MLVIKDLKASVNDTQILNGINLTINPGEVHAIMGPNGSGKSTLSKVIAGHPAYQVTHGEINYTTAGRKELNLHDLEADQRAKEGLFLGMQYPVEIPGVTNFHFLQESFNAICAHHGAGAMDEKDFRDFLKPKLKMLEMSESFLERSVNAGFSGGEKKKNEILQMAVLNPRVAFLDETDSGLDIDALQVVAKGVNQLKNKRNAIVMITHYQRLLDYIQPDFVHVLYQGKIIKTGDKSLALKLEEKGYDWLIKE